MAVNQVSQTNAPKQLGMDDFISAANRAGTYAKSCRFMVVIEPPAGLKSNYPAGLPYMCESADFPGRGFSVVEARYYGPSQVFPTN